MNIFFTIIIILTLIIVILTLILLIRIYGDEKEDDEEEDNWNDDEEEKEEDNEGDVYTKRSQSRNDDPIPDEITEIIEEPDEESSIVESSVVESVFEDSGIRRTKPERICKKAIEFLLKKKFSRIRATFLRNPETNYPLELDCYNDELKVAVEYNGPLHYLHPNYRNQTKEQFLAQRRRDAFKVKRCKELGIKLIVVPYNVRNEDIYYYIKEKLSM